MAMNEDSVVSSLNELRRMASDRARRETASRARVEDQRGHAHRGSIRATEVHGVPSAAFHDVGGPVRGHSPTMLGGMAVAEQQAPQQPGFSYSQYAAQAAAMSEPYQAPVRQKSSAGPVLLTILILGGAAGGSYWKLQQDWSATLAARDAAIVSAEDARNKAVEMASRTEQLYKKQLASCEGSKATVAPAATTASATPAPAAEAAPAVAAPAPKAAAKPARMSRAEKLAAKRAARHAASHRVAARPAPVAAAPAPVTEEKKSSAMPKIAGKKKISDDPLAGLKL
jgi:hypothetical protein